jgi:thioesterase domain-containing protein
LTPKAQLERALELARANGLLAPDVGAEYFARLLRVFKANIQALQKYNPKVYSGRALLLQAAGAADPSVADPMAGWHNLLTGSVAVRVVPGDHFSMLTAPYVNEVAAQLVSHLGKRR